MPRPEFSRWLNPLLRALRELGGSAKPDEAVQRVAENEHVADALLDQTNQSGGGRFANQVHWARFYLAESGLIDRSRRGVWTLTPDGSRAGDLSQSRIEQLIINVRTRTSLIHRAAGLEDGGNDGSARDNHEADAVSANAERDSEQSAPDATPEDYRGHLKRLMLSIPAAGFERLCQRVLREAGFEQVSVTGRSGDGGIDGHGVLALNSFVSFRVLFQCKRYQGAVTPDKVRDFRGAMQGRADKGIILTTGTFTSEARREATRDGAPPIELVDGDKLVDLFADLELGLRPVKAFEVDESFFNEYRN